METLGNICLVVVEWLCHETDIGFKRIWIYLKRTTDLKIAPLFPFGKAIVEKM